MRLLELCQHLATFTAARAFLQNRLVIRRLAPICETCGRNLTEVKCTTSKDDVIYRCPSHKGYKISIRHGSFLASQNISLQDFILLAYFWAHESSISATTAMIGLSHVSVIQWFAYFRDVCSHKLVNNPIQIGGAGIVVEIDESVVARRKYHQGHLVPERWVFGGIDPSTNIGFLTTVENRNADTLLPIIERYIAPGSIIHSDQWAAYNGIININVLPPYQHLTVNHTENFVDPATGATTNHVECMWKNCKRRFKTMQGVHSSMLAGHLDEFMWRQQYAPSHSAAFDNLLSHIADWYPTP